MKWKLKVSINGLDLMSNVSHLNFHYFTLVCTFHSAVSFFGYIKSTMGNIVLKSLDTRIMCKKKKIETCANMYCV